MVVNAVAEREYLGLIPRMGKIILGFSVKKFSVAAWSLELLYLVDGNRLATIRHYTTVD